MSSIHKNSLYFTLLLSLLSTPHAESLDLKLKQKASKKGTFNVLTSTLTDSIGIGGDYNLISLFKTVVRDLLKHYQTCPNIQHTQKSERS